VRFLLRLVHPRRKREDDDEQQIIQRLIHRLKMEALRENPMRIKSSQIEHRGMIPNGVSMPLLIWTGTLSREFDPKGSILRHVESREKRPHFSPAPPSASIASPNSIL
jgi:hypothetical protein